MTSRWYRQWSADYEDAFYADRKALGLGGQNFDHFFHRAEASVLDYPYEYAKEVPESGGTWMRRLDAVAPDLPSMYVYYKVNFEECRIRFVGLSRAWSDDDLAPPPFPDS